MFDFGEAIRKLKEGKLVARTGWNGKNMFLVLVKQSQVLEIYGIGYGVSYHPNDVKSLNDSIKMSSWIGMKTVDNKFVPWLASQTDILTEDWVEV